jgi:TonB family protein
MLYYQEQKWDRHRMVHLKIGFVCSLFISFVFINTHFKTDLNAMKASIWEDPHADLSSLVRVKIQTPHTKSKQIKAPKKENFLLKVDSIFLEPSLDSSLVKEPDTSSLIGLKLPGGDTTSFSAPKLDPPKQQTEEFVLVAERMPLFGDCSHLPSEAERTACSNEQLLKYLYKHIKYPKRALLNGVEGMVIAQIMINNDGKVERPKILRGIGQDCDEEVLRILESMPEWTPGRQNGRKVKVRMKIPVQFKIRD